MLKYLLFSFVLICTFFVGNFMLAPCVPAFFLVYFALMMLRLVFDMPLTVSEIYAMIFSFLLGFSFIFKASYDVDSYYFWFVSAVFFILTFDVFNEINQHKIFIYFSFLLLFILSFFALPSIKSGDIRFSFIFGPNVLYRIFGVFFLIILQYKINCRLYKSNKYIFLVFVSFLLMALGVFATGSRGGTIVFILCFLCFIYRMGLMFGITKVLILILTPAISFVVLKIDLLIELLGRLLYFDSNNASEEYRLSKWDLIDTIFSSSNDSIVFFGLGRGNHIMESYPHNIILEIISYYGLSGVLITSIFLLFSILSFAKNVSYRRFFWVLMPIFFGSLVSGDLFDNVVVFGFLLIGVKVFLDDRKFKLNHV